jgi:hypothetical protein
MTSPSQSNLSPIPPHSGEIRTREILQVPRVVVRRLLQTAAPAGGGRQLLSNQPERNAELNSRKKVLSFVRLELVQRRRALLRIPNALLSASLTDVPCPP